MSAFCEPATQTSTFQASVGRSVAPRPLMASTTNTAGVAATISPSALMSLSTPVLVSLNWQKTALASGCSASACAHVLGLDLGAPLVLQGHHVWRPRAVLSLIQRSPKLPQEATITVSPGSTRLTTALSMAPVPELAKTITSFSV